MYNVILDNHNWKLIYLTYDKLYCNIYDIINIMIGYIFYYNVLKINNN